MIFAYPYKINTIIHGDALKEMEKLPDKAFDFVITDPPYGISVDVKMKKTAGTQYGKSLAPKHDYGATNWDSKAPDAYIFFLMQKVSRHQIIFGGNYFTPSLPPSSGWIVWDKDNGTNNYSDGELIYTSLDQPLRIIRHRWNGMLQEDMANKELRVHPTQKPLVLMKRLISMFTEEGMSILDPFAGSGTTLVAAKQMQRNFLGFEIEEKYVAYARTRLAQEQLL